jgi:branched-chain amino acid transport system ATP-binding protein
MLTIIDIHTYYGDSYVLQGISLEIAKGTVVAVLGRNGAGKTTLIRSIMGLTSPRSGKILFDGEEITHLPSYKIFQRRIGLVPQGRRIFPSLSVEENLRIAARATETDVWNLEKVFALFPRLKERGRNRGNELSGGEQQMLAIARALVSNPLLLLMDEPTEGLAPVLARDVGDTIQRLKAGGQSIFLVEQNLSFAMKFADYAHVVNKGKIVHSSTPNQLWENTEIKQLYLGV